MKYLISILFLTLAINAFAKSGLENPTLVLIEDFSIIEEKSIDLLKKPDNLQNDNVTAYKCYYTVEWLYKECPFIERIVAIV